MSKKIIIAIFVGAILFIGGIWFALLLPNRPYQGGEEEPRGSSIPLFSDLRLGTPVRPEFANQENPPIKQKTEYTILEPIMLRGTTTDAATDTLSLDVRLVDSKSKIISLDPGTVSLEPGTSSYCCWVVNTPGQYTMQIFRPDSVVTTLPIKIVSDFSSLQEQ